MKVNTVKVTPAKRKNAAKAAVLTIRLKKIAKVDSKELVKLVEDIQAAEVAYDLDYTVNGIISKEIAPTTTQSFNRYGDRNRMAGTMALHFIRNSDGMPLDVQAMWLTTNYNVDIEPSDIAEFMINHPCGASSYEGIARINELKAIWKQWTGFEYDSAFAREYVLQGKKKKEKYIKPADAPF